MNLVYYLLFLYLSHTIVMQIFRLSTYHKYFFKALPVLLAYGAIVGWLLNYLKMDEFFLYQLVFASAWLFSKARKSSKQSDALLENADQHDENYKLLVQSLSKTKTYYAYSAFTYMISFSVAYLWIYNS